MRTRKLQRRIASSPLAPLATFPKRVWAVVRHNGKVMSQSLKWLVRSKEHTNLNYELTDRNLRHLATWVSTVTSVPTAQIAVYMDELMSDEALRRHIREATRASPRRWLADEEVRFGRRVGWYAIVRALSPQLVVETGTDKGLGTCVLAAALLKNGRGRVMTVDVNPDSGYLISDVYAAVTDRVVQDSVAAINEVSSPVDLFIHDSWHTYKHERDEIEAVATHLSAHALVVSDNADQTDALLDWAEIKGWDFLYFSEDPKDHWFPGQGIGVARRPAG